MPDLARPWVLLLVVPLVALVWHRLSAGVPVLPQALPRGWGRAGRSRGVPPLPWFFRNLALGILILALAGPRVSTPAPPEEGIAIVFALDLSGSMETRDFQGRTRLEVAREEVARFIGQRPEDLLGLVTFGEEAITRVPPTSNHRHLLEVLQGVEISQGENGTAVGVGLGLAAQRISRVPTPARVIILLTDGRSNTGALEPLAVARAAETVGLRVHAVGIGNSTGEDALDEPLLKQIAMEGDGRYSRARDMEGFREILEELDRLERGPLPREAGLTHRSAHRALLLLGLLLLLCESILWSLPRGRVL